MARKRKKRNRSTSTPTVATPKTSAQKYEILFHVGFEWKMFRTLLHHLRASTADPDEPIRVAMLESFMMHGRILLEFLHGTKKFETDWHVSDLVPEPPPTHPRPSLPPELAEWSRSVNKYVAHLTEDRRQQLDDIRLDEVHNTILRELKALKETMGSDFPSPWNGDEVRPKLIGFDSKFLQPSTAGLLATTNMHPLDLESLNKR